MSKYQEYRPGPRLARYVECYWSHENSEGTDSHRVLPDGCVDILFSAQGGEPVGLEIVGLMTTALKMRIEPGRFFFGVRFRPGMATEFMAEAVHLQDRIEPLNNIVPKIAGELTERLAESRTPLEMAAQMDKLLRPLEPLDNAGKALYQLATVPSSVDNFAQNAGFSTRQLRRLCLGRTGISPKFLLRILRFRNAAERTATIAANGAQPTWTDLALSSGYYDQAHFIREFQTFTDLTPGRYLQSLRENDR